MLNGSTVVQRIGEAGGPAMATRFANLDGLVAAHADVAVAEPPDAHTPVDFDVALVGGGLSVLLAGALAARGLKVVVYERGARIEAHRAWNAAQGELEALVQAGLVAPDELAGLLLARYDHGICRWHGGTTTRVRGVLDCAVDADALLARTLQKLREHGAHIVLEHDVSAMHANRHGVRLAVHDRKTGQDSRVTARVVLDGRGVQSPYARHDLLCPTVGGVLEGLEQTGEHDPERINPRIGEILATTDHVEDGRQHIWEAFPCGEGRVAVYLFYYERARQRTPGALTQLYQRFFSRLSSYKRGTARIVTPTFGFIPGWSRLHAGSVTPHARVVLVGDAAARHSPLTFCGFGAMLRSIQPVTDGVHAFVTGESRHLHAEVDDRAIHRATGALACIMAAPSAAPERAASINTLLSSAFTALHALGPDAYAGLLQDTLPLTDFVRFLRTTSRLRPEVYQDVWRALGPWQASRWAAGLASALARQLPDARHAVPG